MGKQQGELKRVGQSWFVRYYLDRKRKMTKLASVEDYATDKAVWSKFQEFMSNVNKPTDERPVEFRVSARMTVSSFVTEFLKHHADSVRPNTLRGYHTVAAHITPRIGNKKLSTVRTGDVDRMLRSIAEANSEMRHGTLARIKAFTHLVFEEAIRQEIFDGRNPAASAKAVAKNKTVKPTGCYTDSEAQAVIAAVPEPVNVIFTICHLTGLRRSEVLALKWSDYALAESTGGQINVARSLGFGLRGEMVLSLPKTEKSRAPVHVTSDLRLVLNRWKQHQKLDADIVQGCWMFPASESRARRDGKEHGDLLDAAGMPPMQPSNILRIVLPLLSKAKLEWKGWHGFRRGVATELHRAGVQDIVIQRALRHASVTVTQESYIKDVPEVVSDALDKLAQTRAVQRMGNA
jgi:integrase